MKEKIWELRKEITIMKTMNIKPNFAWLASEYGMDYRTVKRYYEGYNGKPSHHNKKSKLLEFDEIIKEKMALKGAKVSSLFFFLQEEYKYKGSYSNLTHYIRKNKINRIFTIKSNSMGILLKNSKIVSCSIINKPN